jgi:RNA polymerase sigma factor (sigma-70 family)
MAHRIVELARRLRIVGCAPGDSNSDAALLDRFVAGSDAEAFSALVARHGPMVLAVCQRVLGNPHTAEDAFQATFLALARHARTVRRPSAVGAWLHGVARRAAQRLRGAAARRGADSLAYDPPAPDPVDPLTGVSARELLTALDEELQNLPERYRLAVVHCHLEGRTVDEAAARLATTPGAVRGWLARARKRLSARLEARGFSLPAALLVLTVEAVTEAPTVNAAAAQIKPAIAAAAEAAVATAGWSRPAWVAVACAGVAVGLATAGLIPHGAAPPAAVPPAAVRVEPKTGKIDPQEALPAGALVRLGDIRFKLATEPVSIRYSPDGTRLAAGDGRGVVHVFDTRTGLVVREIRASGRNGWDDAVPLYSPGGEFLAIVTSGGRVSVWEVPPAKPERIAEKGAAQLWKLSPQDADVKRLAFSPDGKVLAGGEEGEGKRVRLWDAASGKELRTSAAHPENITGLAFAPDGKTLATSCEDGGVRLFDPTTCKERRRIEHSGKKALAVAYSPDGKMIAWTLSGTRDDKAVNELVLWDAESAKEVARSTWGDGAVSQLVFTPDGRQVLGADASGTHVWNAETAKEDRFLRGVGIGKYPTLAVARDGKTLAAPWMKEVAFYEIATGARRERSGPERQLTALAYAPDGKTVATGGEGGTLYLYDAATGKLLRELPRAGQGVKGVAFAPDGKMLAVAGGLSASVGIWDAESGTLVRTITDPDKDGGFASAVAYSPDGKTLAVTSYGAVRLLDPATGKQIRRLVKAKFGAVHAIAFSPDGKLLATAGADRTLRLWDVATGEQLELWYHREEFTSVAFAPDGKRIVWGSRGGWCQVWEVPSGRILARIRGHEYSIESVAFTPDGKRVVTAGTFDTGPRVWNADTGKELLGFRGHLANPQVVTVAPDGKTAASAGADSQVLIWDLATLATGTGPVGPPVLTPAVESVPDGAVRLGAAGSAGGQVAFSPDGKWIASSVLVPGSEASVAVWNAATHKMVWTVEDDRDQVVDLSWVGDGKTVAAVCYSEGSTALVLFDAATGKELKRVRGLPSVAVYAVAPDGKMLAARHPAISTAKGERFGGEIDLFDVATGKRVRRLEGHDGDSVAWSPDGKVLASGSIHSSPRDTIRLWDPATGAVLREWDTGLGGVRLLTFLADGTLASGGNQGLLKIWNVRTGKPIREVDGKFGLAMAISADGTRFGLHSFGSPVVVRDVRTGRQLGAYDAGPRWFGFALPPDGKVIATAGNGNLLLWPVPLRDKR